MMRAGGVAPAKVRDARAKYRDEMWLFGQNVPGSTFRPSHAATITALTGTLSAPGM